jgi:oligoribonuclease NrnB/cAMP/cGMP phosphodiesterase (DHH superfamily)
MTKKVSLGSMIGEQAEESFLDFDMTEIHEVLHTLKETDAIDISHAEMLQQQALRAADIISDYLGRMVKTIGYLENRVNSLKNKTSLEYTDPNGGRVTSEMRVWAGNCSKDVVDLQDKLAQAKASKMVLDKKYDILIKSHHHYKDIANGLRKGILGYNPGPTHEKVEGWE